MNIERDALLLISQMEVTSAPLFDSPEEILMHARIIARVALDADQEAARLVLDSYLAQLEDARTTIKNDSNVVPFRRRAR